MIKDSSLHENSMHYKEFINCLGKFYLKMKKLSYVKLHQTKCLYLPFLFPSPVSQSFFSLSVSSLFGTQPQLTHPPVKSSTLPLRKMPFFRALRLGIQFSLHPASSFFGTQQQLTHPPVKSSSLPLWTNHVSQGLLLCNVLLPGLFLVWYSPIFLIKSIYAFILSVVYFYSERSTLSKIFYYMCCLFL